MHGHILHAVNLPLFNNEERKQVGTTYKQQNSNAAILEGLDIVGKKMSGFVKHVQPLVKDNKIFIHCWRGGMRSGSMAWLFNLFGYDVYTLKGGYKSYRRLVLESLGKPNQYIVIGGCTGSGKTAILSMLQQMGEQVLDMEALAHHKGSAFGMLGQQPQPSSEHFENKMHEVLAGFDLSQRIWIEDESKKIGTVVIDNGFWNAMKAAPVYVIDLPVEVRVKRLVEEYAGHEIEGLEQSIANIKKRLGGLEYKAAIEALQNKDFEKVAAITLHYYDKAYNHSINARETGQLTRFGFNNDDVKAIASKLLLEAKKEPQLTK